MLKMALIQSALQRRNPWSLDLGFGHVMQPSLVRTVPKGGRQTRRIDAYSSPLNTACFAASKQLSVSTAVHMVVVWGEGTMTLYRDGEVLGARDVPAGDLQTYEKGEVRAPRTHDAAKTASCSFKALRSTRSLEAAGSSPLGAWPDHVETSARLDQLTLIGARFVAAASGASPSVAHGSSIAAVPRRARATMRTCGARGRPSTTRRCTTTR